MKTSRRLLLATLAIAVLTAIGCLVGYPFQESLKGPGAGNRLLMVGIGAAGYASACGLLWLWKIWPAERRRNQSWGESVFRDSLLR